VSHTRLHGEETRPGIVGAAIAEASVQGEEQTDEVRVGGIDGLPPALSEGRSLLLWLLRHLIPLLGVRF
jgi:hypothetical protein